MNSAHVFFKEGKLYLIPELPTEQHNLHLPVEIEKVKANALPVVNPEVADNTELPFPGNRIVRLRKENEIFEWPGTWEKTTISLYTDNYRCKEDIGYAAKLIAPQQSQANKTDNELIAEFMGGIKGDPASDVSDLWFFNGKHEKYLRYRTSWDCLMPVVEKINTMIHPTLGERLDVIIYRNTCHINDQYQIVIETTGKNMLDCTYKAVVEFIKWYNAQPKQL